ncbi:iron chelate uptake ABC transporter family permease subunit [candidate division GN15 bacterium]|nr:iron chelate uptake ABC transporter family permease subunit [candidate division GN15 bacterium]
MTIRFFSLADANVRWVVAGSILLGATAGALGSFAYLQRRSLLGDALAHSALPGVGLAFLLVGEKDFMALLIGAAIAGWLGALAVNAITRHSKLKQDAALGIVLTVFFGLGVVVLTHIQKTGAGSQAGLDSFLFGQAAALGERDVILLSIVAVVLLSMVALGFRSFTLLSFDPGFARSIGLPVRVLQFVLTTMIVLAVTIGLQAVGVVLIAALLITPAAAARQWTDKLSTMVILAALFGALSGLLGGWVSFLAPRMPTGPWVVVVISVVFAVSILFAPKRGVISRLRRHLRNRGKVAQEHILKAMFKSGYPERDWSGYQHVSDIDSMWSFSFREMARGLRRLEKRGLLERSDGSYRLTEDGVVEGARVIRRHRLWELYLTRYLELPGDHVHRDADDIEHILTPEMEAQLEELLEHPEYDPHHQEIPRIGREASQ